MKNIELFSRSDVQTFYDRKMRFQPLFLFIFLLLSNILSGQDPTRFRKEIEIIESRNSGKANTHDLIVFTGSSSVRRWQNINDFFPGKNIINTGFGASQMSDLLYYSDTVIINYKPVQVFIYEGDNDVAAGKKTEKIIQEAEMLVRKIRRELPGTQIVFISVKPSVLRWNLRDEYIKLNNEYRRLSKENRKVKFIDVWNPLLDSSGKPKKEIFIADSLHINKLGYDIWAGEIKKVIK